METMAEEAKRKGKSRFRGHHIVLIDAQWVYEDDKKPIPSGGGVLRACAKCGSAKWSGDGEVDECLGVLPGVKNACCGHGDKGQAYITFENGMMIKGFEVVTAIKPEIKRK